MNVNLEAMAAVPRHDGAAPSAAPRSAATRVLRALHRWWQGLWIDEMSAYLSGATNHVELEYRMRAWNDAARRLGRAPFV